MKYYKFLHCLLCLLFLYSCFSCSSSPSPDENIHDSNSFAAPSSGLELPYDTISIEKENMSIRNKTIEIDTIDLTFTGDIMAHSVNFEMRDYDSIYDDVRIFLKSDDLSFANFETPVADTLPLSSYPCFNVHTSYLQSAVRAGFDVYSIANNHSLDQGESGIKETLTAFDSMNDIHYSGLKKSDSEEMKPLLIHKDGWNIIFLSVTEILNFPPSRSRLINYVNPDEHSRSQFITKLKHFRNSYPCDVFILSLHTFEPEYCTEVSSEKKKWFVEIAAAGVDIIWAHHPHVLQPWEVTLISRDSQQVPVLFLYSLGNFISGQRFTPDLTDPEGVREFTGDGVLLQVQLQKKYPGTGLSGILAVPFLITNYTDPSLRAPIVKSFDDSFLHELSPVLFSYYNARMNILESYFSLLPSNHVQSILIK